MNITVPKEVRFNEYRVGLSPLGVEALVQQGHACIVEHSAGLGAGFRDADYEAAGARMVFSHEEAFRRGDLVVKVARPLQEELEWLEEGQIILAFLNLAVASPQKVETLLTRKITALAYEQIQLPDGRLPVLNAMSEIGGRMAAQVAATLLQNDRGGKGILLGGLPGVPPAEVGILGAGAVGRSASRAFLGLGAHLTVLDQNPMRLEEIDSLFPGRLVTLHSTPVNIARTCRYVDVLLGAVLVPGERAPIVVTREMVRSMKPRSVILDLSIDQGGCVETSRPTSHDRPTFEAENVIHYCVPNMPGVVARTATHALNAVATPYIQEIARLGLEEAVRADSALGAGVCTLGGKLLRVLSPGFDPERES
ncbi:MAG: alanine dehydrogenase [Anaerolineales bacterium]|jgi:alanine dehydrogenase